MNSDTDIVVYSPEYGETVWPGMGMLRGFADWCVRWESQVPTDDALRILDVGGGAGAFTLVCKRMWPNSLITVLEPSPNMLPYLHNNVDNLEDVEILPYAASNAEFSALLSMPDGPGEYQVLGRETLHGVGDGVSTVQCYRLDDLIDYPINVIKVDVEEHEVECFEGATRILESYHPDVIVEVKRNILFTAADPRPLLEKLGYVFRLKMGQDYWASWVG